MNHGEKQEALFKLYLIFLRDNNSKIKNCFGDIKSVGLHEEYPKTRLAEKQIRDLSKNTDDKKLLNILEESKIKKGGRDDKADIQINGIYYSLKNFSAGKPSIINHTSRYGFVRIAKQLNLDINKIDEHILNYWNLREEKKITEDCGNNHPLSPIKKFKEIWRPYIEYFCFSGTGKGDSKIPADYLFKFTKFNEPSTWTIISKKEAVDKIWDNLFFCMRGGKGMNGWNNKSKKIIMQPWTRFSKGRFRGALSVRIDNK